MVQSPSSRGIARTFADVFGSGGASSLAAAARKDMCLTLLLLMLCMLCASKAWPCETSALLKALHTLPILIAGIVTCCADAEVLQEQGA